MRPEVQVLPGPPVCSRRCSAVLKKLVLAAVAAGALVAVRKRAGGKAEADLWHEATRGPQAVSTPSAR